MLTPCAGCVTGFLALTTVLFNLTGQVVAVRVTSEDANDGFKPTCGFIDEISFRPSPDVWGYFSVKSGGGIHEFSDSQVNLLITTNLAWL